LPGFSGALMSLDFLADSTNVATDTPVSNHPTLNNTVIAAFFVNGKPMAVNCIVTSEAPLVLFTKDARVTGLGLPQAVIMVWHRGEDVVKGEADVVAVKPWKSGYALEIKHTQWKEVDRRQYTRYKMTLPVSLRAVMDCRGSTVFTVFQGETVDVSAGGAWVKVEPQIAMGSLVEFKTTMPDGESFSAFAMVAHQSKERGGVGLEFLDFLGGSRESLEERLKQAA